MSGLSPMVADAVVAEFAATPPAMPSAIAIRSLTVERAYMPRQQLTGIGTDIIVSVGAGPHEGEISDRARMERMIDAQLAIQARVERSSTGVMDALLELGEIMVNRFPFTRLDLGSGNPSPVFVAFENDLPYDPRQLIADGSFLSIWTITFQLFTEH